MNFLSKNEQVLMHRLGTKGMEQGVIPGFIWSLKSCLLDNPDMNHFQTNKRMQFLGWNDFDLDYHTLQLAIACFEAEGFRRSEIYSSKHVYGTKGNTA
jgi:hypothetical protein